MIVAFRAPFIFDKIKTKVALHQDMAFEKFMATLPACTTLGVLFYCSEENPDPAEAEAKMSYDKIVEFFERMGDQVRHNVKHIYLMTDIEAEFVSLISVCSAKLSLIVCFQLYNMLDIVKHALNSKQVVYTNLEKVTLFLGPWRCVRVTGEQWEIEQVAGPFFLNWDDEFDKF